MPPVMADMVETERKFLVASRRWPAASARHKLRQGYILDSNGSTLRIRQRDKDYFLTLKAPKDAVSRYEFEYPIPPEHGRVMLGKLCSNPPVEKLRHTVCVGADIWEIDEFTGANKGLLIAEIELDDPDQPVRRPDWLGPEVTGDSRFLNANLYHHPFQDWGVAYGDLLEQAQAI